LDVDGDGDISQEEFIDGYLKMHTTVGKANAILCQKNKRSVMKYVEHVDGDSLYRAYS
jgi:hypothetical protein